MPSFSKVIPNYLAVGYFDKCEESICIFHMQLIYQELNWAFPAYVILI